MKSSTFLTFMFIGMMFMTMSIQASETKMEPAVPDIVVSVLDHSLAQAFELTLGFLWKSLTTPF